MAQAGRRAFVGVMLVAVSAAMVYGTWLAVDDMRAQPLSATVTRATGGIRVENSGAYGWQDLRLSVNGRYLVARPLPVEPGGSLIVPFADLRSATGDPMPASEGAVEVALVVTRRPRFPRVNRARTASGTFQLD